MQAVTVSRGAPPSALLPPAPAPGASERAEWESFGRPLPDRPGCWESSLAIEGIYCAGCTLTIEQALAGLPGVREVDVNGAAATVRIVWDTTQGRPAHWFAALERAG